MKHFITFDLEYWYDSEFVRESSDNDFVVEGIEKVVSLLDKHKVKATFFVTGKVIEKYPAEIKKLAMEGHEIASHGFSHTMLNKLNKKEIEDEFEKSVNLIKKITGKRPAGFRAPSWSISKNQFWIYKLLRKLGFSYSSSIFPVNVGLYGDGDFPVNTFHPIEKEKFIEIPIRPYILSKLRIPFSGGVYFRILPRILIRTFIRELSKRNERVVLYLHPWEFCPDIPKVKTSLIGKVTTYWGLRQNLSKLDYMLREFEFDAIKNILKEKINY